MRIAGAFFAYSSRTLARLAPFMLFPPLVGDRHICAGGGCTVEDLPGLKCRASDLRQRIADFLKDFGRDLIPELRQLHDELAQIEQHLKALGEHAPDESPPGSGTVKFKDLGSQS